MGVRYRVVIALWLAGNHFELGWIYKLSVLGAAGLFAYQQYLTQNREKSACFQAFLSNHWVGMIVFVGIVLEYAFKS